MTSISTDKKGPPFIPLIPIILISFIGIRFPLSARPQELPPQTVRAGLLKLLKLEASPESIDYVQRKTQFQLHTLLTEQRHPKTWNLSERLQKDIAEGLTMLFSVDEDIVARLEALGSESRALEPLVAALEQALLARSVCSTPGGGKKASRVSRWAQDWTKADILDDKHQYG